MSILHRATIEGVSDVRYSTAEQLNYKIRRENSPEPRKASSDSSYIERARKAREIGGQRAFGKSRSKNLYASRSTLSHLYGLIFVRNPRKLVRGNKILPIRSSMGLDKVYDAPNTEGPRILSPPLCRKAASRFPHEPCSTYKSMLSKAHTEIYIRPYVKGTTLFRK